MQNATPVREPIVRVTALVDWNSQIHAAAPPRGIAEEGIAERTLSYVGRIISRALNQMQDSSRYDVILRIYGGWHRGFEVTPRRKALVTVAAQSHKLSAKPNVNIRPNIEFGDNLISAAYSRLHTHINAHLGDTLRRSLLKKDIFVEKMVDTSIAADLVDLAHSDPTRWIIVIGEDDDLIPPLLVASNVRTGTPGRVAIIRQRNQTSFLKFNDLRIAP